MNRDPCILVWIGSALCSDGVDLIGWISSIDVAILEHDGRIAKYKVNSAIDVTLFIELSLRMNIERVLITLKATSIKDRKIRARS